MACRARLSLGMAALSAVLATGAGATARELEIVQDLKWQHPDAAYAGVRRVMFTADGGTLLSAGYYCVRLWDVTGDKPSERAAVANIKNIGRHGLWDAQDPAPAALHVKRLAGRALRRASANGSKR